MFWIKIFLIGLNGNFKCGFNNLKILNFIRFVGIDMIDIYFVCKLK